MSVASCGTGINNFNYDYVSLLLLKCYNFIWNNLNSHVAILSIVSRFHDVTWVLPHTRTAVALGIRFIWTFRDVSVAFVIRRGGA